MRTALHPFTATNITVPDYIKEFGNDKSPLREKAICPICKQQMTPVVPSNPNTIEHFAHQRGSGFCPTKSKNALPYLGLMPRTPDIEAARRIRRAFVEHWQKHFSKLKFLVPGLSIQEFMKAIEIADRERIWEYKELEPFQLPYIFATLMDYPPSTSFKLSRMYWFRCWFDSSVGRYDDLWIYRETPVGFWRGSYRLEQGKRKPSGEDLVKCYEIEIEGDFLDKNVQIHDYVTKIIDSFIQTSFQDVL